MQLLFDEWSRNNIDTHEKFMAKKSIEKFEQKEHNRIVDKEQQKFKRWFKKYEPIEGQLYWISYESSFEKQRLTVGKYVSWSMDIGEKCFLIIGSGDPVNWKKVKILGDVIQEKYLGKSRR
jgi:hypothetical protein